MDAKEIKKKLKDNQLRVTDVAHILGVSIPMVSRVIHGKSKSSRIQRAITRLTSSVQDLWPDAE